MASFLTSPVLGRFLEVLGYTAKTVRYLYPTEPTVFFAEIASERLLKTHTAALQKELKRQDRIETETTARTMLIEELGALEKTLTARQMVTEDRIVALLQSALKWEAEGGQLEIGHVQMDELERADRAFDDLILAAKVLQSSSVHSCTIEFKDGAPLRFLKWLMFPPRTLLLGAAFEGELRFKDCLPNGLWTNGLIQVMHSIVRESDSALRLQLGAEYCWATTELQPNRFLSLEDLTSQPGRARLSKDPREEPLEVARQELPPIFRFGQEPKLLLLPNVDVAGHVAVVRLPSLPMESPLIIYHLQPKENYNDA